MMVYFCVRDCTFCLTSLRTGSEKLDVSRKWIIRLLSLFSVCVIVDVVTYAFACTLAHPHALLVLAREKGIAERPEDHADVPYYAYVDCCELGRARAARYEAHQPRLPPELARRHGMYCSSLGDM